MQVDLEVQRVSASESIPDDQQFQLWTETVLAGRGTEFSLNIRVADEDEAQRFNLEYRGKDYATNVLSFPAELPEGLPQELRQSQLGDLLICSPVVKREAAEQRRAEADHWAHLVIHGVLHLLGYDHEEASEAEMMESLEIEILASLGVSDPYQEIA
jgi:probable rRNA maturation factor